MRFTSLIAAFALTGHALSAPVASSSGIPASSDLEPADFAGQPGAAAALFNGAPRTGDIKNTPRGNPWLNAVLWSLVNVNPYWVVYPMRTAGGRVSVPEVGLFLIPPGDPDVYINVNTTTVFSDTDTAGYNGGAWWAGAYEHAVQTWARSTGRGASFLQQVSNVYAGLALLTGKESVQDKSRDLEKWWNIVENAPSSPVLAVTGAQAGSLTANHVYVVVALLKDSAGARNLTLSDTLYGHDQVISIEQAVQQIDSLGFFKNFNRGPDQ